DQTKSRESPSFRTRLCRWAPHVFRAGTATIKAHTFLTPLTITSAKVIATYESTPVAATRKVGKGQVFYVGTNLGASIEDGDRAGIDLVRAMVTQVVSPADTADKVRPRLVETSQ